MFRTEKTPLLPDADNAAEGKSNLFSSPLLFIMTVLGIIALISGVAGVLLTIRQNIWCWPMALLSVVTSGVEFYQSRLFGDMALQVFYFISGIYGWYYWGKKKNEEFVVSKLSLKSMLPLIAFTFIQFGIYYYLLTVFKGDKIFLDALLTACSITATYMMTKKWIENWAFWVLIDAVYVGLYFSKELYLYALLYFIFAVMALAGFLNWKKHLS
jgi:nicotinamide mononucleotide transporter